jgi:hypothetical protein
MSGLIRNLTALSDLRILEVRVGRATLQIMLYFSWSVVCIGSGSSHWLTTSVVEVLSLRCLCNFLNQILGEGQNVGLHVVATVCDMGTNSVKAMKLLGSIRREPFFQFQSHATATIYDPPHLLKYIRNLFLKYDVQVESEHLDSQFSVIAKWEHTEKLYKHDKLFMIRMLSKLTPTWPCYSVCYESELGYSSREPQRNLHSGV